LDRSPERVDPDRRTLLWLKFVVSPEPYLSDEQPTSQTEEIRPMFISRWVIPAVTAFALGCAGPGLAVEPPAHGDKAAVAKLRLNQGKKWQTDEALRRGMNEIRAAMTDALTPIHENVFTPAQYDALAARTQAQIDYVVSNCKLPEAADQQLHIVLEQIIDGVAEMKAATGRDQGAAKIVQALGQYGDYFNHAGWRPVGAPTHGK
jgi:hypothetical protein